VKVRIGVSLAATESAGGPGFAAGVDELEERGIDSLWFSELVYSPLVDPFIGMAYALSRTTSLKVGTGVAVLPGRSPILVAKQLASLARLAPKRVLPVFGLSPARKAERVAFPVPEGKRAAVFDESLQVIKLLLTQQSVSFQGEFFSFDEATVGELPATPVDVWLGGSAPAGLRRIGRYGDGWLASFITPEEAAAGIEIITETAREAGREVDPDHFGISLAVAFGELPEQLVAAVGTRRELSRPGEPANRARVGSKSGADAPLDSLIPQGWEAAQKLIGRYVEAGLSKFVIRTAGSEAPDDFLTGFISELVPLQT
jgi:probable F420-dependent oxidoreductase